MKQEISKRKSDKVRRLLTQLKYEPASTSPEEVMRKLETILEVRFQEKTK